MIADGGVVRAENGHELAFAGPFELTGHTVGETAIRYEQGPSHVFDIYRDADGVRLTSIRRQGAEIDVSVSADRRTLEVPGAGVTLPGPIQSGVEISRSLVVVAVDQGHDYLQNVYGVDVAGERIVWQIDWWDRMPLPPFAAPYGPVYLDSAARLIAANNVFSAILDPRNGRIVDSFESR